MSRTPVLVVSVVVAIAIGIGLGALLFGGDEGSSSGGGQPTPSGGSTAAVELPEELGEFRDIVEATAAKGGDQRQQDRQRNQQAQTKESTAAAYSKAYDGAAATYRQYADESLDRLPWVIAVRAPAPGLTIGPLIDPAFLRLAVPQQQVKTVGEVECRVDTIIPTAEGNRPDPGNQNATMCQRSSDNLTVFAGGGGFRGPDGLEALAELTNAAWKAAR